MLLKLRCLVFAPRVATKPVPAVIEPETDTVLSRLTVTVFPVAEVLMLEPPARSITPTNGTAFLYQQSSQQVLHEHL